MLSQYDGGGYDGPGSGAGYGYWPDERHQPMFDNASSMMPPPHHQLAGPRSTLHELAGHVSSTLEYRPPPRRAYPTGPLHPPVVPVMADDSTLGLLLIASYSVSLAC